MCSCYSRCHADGMVGTCDGKCAKGNSQVCSTILLGIIILEVYSVENFYSLIDFSSNPGRMI